jgi:hypothetical protein
MQSRLVCQIGPRVWAALLLAAAEDPENDDGGGEESLVVLPYTSIPKT